MMNKHHHFFYVFLKTHYCLLKGSLRILQLQCHYFHRDFHLNFQLLYLDFDYDYLDFHYYFDGFDKWNGGLHDFYHAFIGKYLKVKFSCFCTKNSLYNELFTVPSLIIFFFPLPLAMYVQIV